MIEVSVYCWDCKTEIISKKVTGSKRWNYLRCSYCGSLNFAKASISSLQGE